MAWDDREYYRDEPPRIRLAIPMPGPATIGIIAACLLAFIAVNVFRSGNLANWGILSFINGQAFKEPWRWVTYAYLHGGGSHLFWNLLGLYFFLVPLEQVWGWRKTLGFYTLATVAAGATFGIMCIFYPFRGLIGASGGVLAALGACAYLFPGMMIFMIIPIRIFAALAGVLYLLTIAGDRDPSDAAHLGGLVFGFFAPYYGGHLWRRVSTRWEARRELGEARADRKLAQREQNEQATIDAILAKVSAHGMQSLTWLEKRTLRKATERQRKSDALREAKYKRSVR